MLADILIVAIIAISVVVTAAAGINWRRTHWWVYLAFALTWAAWAVVYAWVLAVDPADYNPVWFGQTIIRPLNVWSFFLVASVMVYRVRQNGRN